MLTVKECFTKFVNNAEVVDIYKAIGEFIISRATDTSKESDMLHGIEEFNKDLLATDLIETEEEKDDFYAVLGECGFNVTLAEANEKVRTFIVDWLLKFTPHWTGLETPPVKVRISKLHHEMKYKHGVLPRPNYGEFAKPLEVK